MGRELTGRSTGATFCAGARLALTWVVVIGMTASGDFGPGVAGPAALEAQSPASTTGYTELTMREYVGAQGALQYGIYVPERATAPMPLVVMLHGCLQSAGDFAAGTRMAELARENEFVVVFLERTEADHPQKCWNWFDPEHQQRGQGEPALVAGVTREVVQSHPIATNRVYLAGVSAGGAMAAIVATQYPELFEAVGIHSGVPFGVASGVQAALAVMAGSDAEAGARAQAAAAALSSSDRFPRLITIHGGADAVVAVENAEHLVNQWSAIAARTGHSPRGLAVESGLTQAGFHWERTAWEIGTGQDTLIERMLVRDLGHAWAGGSASGSYAMPGAPDASREMLRFFGIIRHTTDPGGAE